MKVLHFIRLVCLGFMLAACQAGGLGLPGQVEPTSPPPTVTATVVPTLTPLPTRTRTPVPTTTATPTPAAAAPANLGVLLSAENIAQAQAAALPLPLTPSGIYWPGGARLLLLGEGSLQSINLAPLSVGAVQTLENNRILSLSPDGSTTLLQRGDGGVHILNRLDGSDIPVKFAAAYFGVYAQDGKTIALGNVDHFAVTLLDAATGKPIKTLMGFETAAPVYSAMPAPGGKTMVWYARATVQVQDVASEKMLVKLSFQDFVSGLTYSPDGQWLLVAVGGGLLQAVHVAAAGSTEAIDLTLEPGVQALSPVFSPDGRLVAAGVGSDVIVWETTAWKQVARLKQHTGQARLLSFSPDGKVLVSIDDQNLLAAWGVP